jgi:hypothetical protein
MRVSIYYIFSYCSTNPESYENMIRYSLLPTDIVTSSYSSLAGLEQATFENNAWKHVFPVPKRRAYPETLLVPPLRPIPPALQPCHNYLRAPFAPLHQPAAPLSILDNKFFDHPPSAQAPTFLPN